MVDEGEEWPGVVDDGVDGVDGVDDAGAFISLVYPGTLIYPGTLVYPDTLVYTGTCGVDDELPIIRLYAPLA